MKAQWSIQTRYLALVIVLLVLAGLVYFAQALISPLIIAALLAYVLEPGVAFLVRRGRMRRKYAVALVYAVFLVTLASIPAILTPVVIAQLDDIRDEIVNLQSALRDALEQGYLFGFPFPSESQPSEAVDLFSLLFNPQRIFGVLQAATENLAWVLIIFVTTFYFLLDGERLKTWLFKLAPEAYQEDVARLHGSIKVIWEAYLRGQLLLMFTVGTLTWLAGATVGLRGALLIGIVAGALDVIPSLGPAVAMVIAAGLAFFEGSSLLPLSRLWFALLIVGIFLAIQAFENVWLRPRVLSQSLRLHPAVVFVAIVGALALAGVVAALIIVPAISTAQVIGRYVFRRVLGQDPWPEPVTLTAPVEAQEPAVVSAQAVGSPGSTAAAEVQGTKQDIPD